MQHTSGDNADKKVTIQQIQTVPQLFVSTWSSGLGTATCINFPSFTPILGQVFSITFVNAFTYDGNANIKINGVTYPLKAHGIQCAKNFCKAGNSFTAMIKTTATTGGTEYVDLDTDCVSVSTSTITQSNGQVVPLNSALTALKVKSITPTVEVNTDGGWGTYTLNYCKMQRVGDFYFCYGSIKVGSDSIKKYLYIAITGDGVNFSRDDGYRLDSRVAIFNSNDGSSEGGILYSLGTRALWLRKGYYMGGNTEASTYNGQELAGKTVTFSFMASKIS